MSRVFASSADHLDSASTIIVAPPMTMLAWVKMTTLALGYQIVTIGTAGSASNRFSMGYQATNTIGCNENDGTSSIAQSVTSISETKNWHAAAAVWSDRTNRAAFLDGAGKGTIAALKAATTPNSIRISGDPQATPANPFQGLIGMVAIWNVALTDTEVAALASAYPLAVRPQSLVHLWDLSIPGTVVPDLGSGNKTLSITGAAFNADSPPVTAGVGPGGAPEKRKRSIYVPQAWKGESEEEKTARRIEQGILAASEKPVEDTRSAAERQVQILKAQIAAFEAESARYRERIAAMNAASAKRNARNRAARAAKDARALYAQIERIQREERSAQELIEEFDIAVIASLLAEV